MFIHQVLPQKHHHYLHLYQLPQFQQIIMHHQHQLQVINRTLQLKPLNHQHQPVIIVINIHLGIKILIILTNNLLELIVITLIKIKIIRTINTINFIQTNQEMGNTIKIITTKIIQIIKIIGKEILDKIGKIHNFRKIQMQQHLDNNILQKM